MKKSILKLISVTLCLTAVLSVICVEAESFVPLYTEDGRIKYFLGSQVEEQLRVGWYPEPVKRLYAEGKSALFLESQVDAQLKVGWYTEPVRRLYTEGKSALFVQSQVEAQLEVGWFLEPVQKLYAENKEKLFPKSQVQAQLAVGWSTEPFVRLYTLDGRSKMFMKSQVEAQIKVGWFNGKPVKMYAEDGRTKYVGSNDVAANEKVGWYKEPVQRLYALGKSKVFKKSQVAAQLKVGWYTEPVTKMYALNGKSKIVPNSQIAKNKEVGWYLYADYVCARADKLKKSSYNSAVSFLENEMWSASGTDYVRIYEKRKALCNAWYAANDWVPMYIGTNYVKQENGVKVLHVKLRNLTQKAIVYFETEFTCYNSSGKVASTYYNNGKIYSTMESTYHSPCTESEYTVKLSGNSSTAYVKNYQVKKVIYSDGTVWYRY